jgi:putative metallohydrolase (TIGR04338 family)
VVDSRRARVYSAEQQVRDLFDSADERGVRTVVTLGSTITLPVERRFASVESMQAYVDQVLALNWVGARYPQDAPAPRVIARRGQLAAHYLRVPPTIAIPPYAGNRAWAAREFVLLHEIAHHLTPGDTGHGAGFLACYLDLVGEIVGAEAALLLDVALRENGAR